MRNVCLILGIIIQSMQVNAIFGNNENVHGSDMWRGPVAKWFSTLVTEQMVRGSSPNRDNIFFDWETLSVHQVARGYLIQFREGSNAAGGRDGLRLPYVVPLKR